MKRVLLAPLFLVWICVNAQPVFTKDWFPVAGDSYVMTRVASTSFNFNTPPPDTGQNILWDFSQLQLISNRDTFGYSSPSSCINDCNLILDLSPSGGIELLSGTDTVQMWVSMSPNGYWRSYFTFPLSYASNFQDGAGYSDLSFSSNYIRRVTADGWGKLILPNDTFENTLRLKITSERSNFQRNGAVVSSSYSDITVSYQWIHSSVSHALLKMDYYKYYDHQYAHQPPNDYYTDSSLAVSLLTSYHETQTTIQETGYEDFNCIFYPNPATNQLNITFNGVQIEQVSIFNVDGKLVNETKQPTNNRIDISNLAKGVYVAQVKVREVIVRKRWVKI